MVYCFRHKHKVALFCLAATALTLFSSTSAGTGELPFNVGEKLTYEGKWLFFKAGKAVSHIPEKVNENGRDLLHFSLHTETTNIIASIWTMDDHFDSFWDPKLQATRRLKVRIRESTYENDKEVLFHHQKGIAIVKQNEDPPEEFNLEKGANDFFAGGHFARTFPLKVKEKYEYPIFEDNQNYHMIIKVLKKERINMMGGKIDTIMTKIRVKFEGAFKSKDTLYVWFSDDQYKAPVKLKLSSFFGSVVLNLVEYEGLELNIIKD